MTTKRRADFAENRIRILDAAHEVFIEGGVGAPLDSIAKRAGVGRATFFRHFPDRRALINEMLDLYLVKLEHKAQDIPATSEGLFDLVRYFFDEMIAHAPIADYLRAQGRDDPALLDAIDRFNALLKPHVLAAIKEGSVGPELRTNDIVILATMLAAAATTPNIGPEGRKRAYEVVFAGLRQTNRDKATV
ncbi:MAG TPA: TetR family transcriptional regulator [Maritimibacter sp.]|nr:TetR family transcriptional regulator [Maritimibacter sp.]